MSDKLSYKPHSDPDIAAQQALADVYYQAAKWTQQFKRVDDPRDSYRRRTLKPDNKGSYRPYLGVRQDLQPHRFNLGTDLREAEKRVNRLYELWEENVRANDGFVYWSHLALEFAQKIAQGQKKIILPPEIVPVETEDAVCEYAQMLRKFRETFPSLDLLPFDESYFVEGKRRNQSLLDTAVANLEYEARDLGALGKGDEMPMLVSGTLHEAFDAYVSMDVRNRNVRAGSEKLTQYGKKRIERVEAFKQRHENVPLGRLSLDACSKMIRYWCNRPPKKNRKTKDFDGPPIAYRSAINYRKELDTFFDWLDGSEAFAWGKPRRFDRIDRKVVKEDEDRAKKLRVITKDVYNVDQLAILNRHATPLERLLLYIGLNCGMGAAEIGRLTFDDFIVEQVHEYAQLLNFPSKETDSFIRYLRPKTEVFGEFYLWPETVEIAKWGMERSRKFGSRTLFISERREAWYNEDSKNPQAKFANVWMRLVKRVRSSDSTFPYLPFGSLRDTLPTTLRTLYSDDLASLCLTHGVCIKPQDTLLDCYSNRPFGRFHTAVKALREIFAPVFDAAPSDPTAQPKKRYMSLAKEQKILAKLNEGIPVEKVAQQCAVSKATVYRIRQQQEGHSPAAK